MSIKFNMQQQPKTPGYMACFKARPGFKLVQSDLSAIEPHILAEFTRDPTMWKLYGPGAKQNDIYLYNASFIELFRDEVRAFYDPDNPTAESVALAKKKCKQTRGFNKAITLACIAEGTPILTKERGYVPIQLVTELDEVWDGESWVCTDGAIYKGVRECRELNGVLCTDDHKFLTTSGWKEANEIREGTEDTQCIRPQYARYSWTDVWSMGSYLARSTTHWWLSTGFSSLRSFIRRCVEKL